jgi:hypothetical protein
MIDADEGLHRLRRQPHLVADRIAMHGAQQRHIFVLDVVGVGHRRKAGKRLELRAGLVLGNQRLGGAARCGVLHDGLPFWGS